METGTLDVTVALGVEIVMIRLCALVNLQCGSLLSRFEDKGERTVSNVWPRVGCSLEGQAGKRTNGTPIKPL